MIFDISYRINRDFAVYPGDPEFELKKIASIENGAPCNVSHIGIGSHMGTHIDAFYHFIPDGDTLDQLPLEQLMGPAKVIYITGKTHITPSDLRSFDIQKDDIVILKTDNSLQFDGSKLLDTYTAITKESAEFLVDKKIKLIGIDYVTIEPYDHHHFEVHHTLLKNRIPIVETLKLKDIKPETYEFICLPLKIQGGDGGPVRAILKR